MGIVVNRVLRDDPGKGDMNNRAGLSIRDLWDACRDVDLWPASPIDFRRKRITLTRRLALLHRYRVHDTPKHAGSVHHIDTSFIGIRSGKHVRTNLTKI